MTFISAKPPSVLRSCISFGSDSPLEYSHTRKRPAVSVKRDQLLLPVEDSVFCSLGLLRGMSVTADNVDGLSSAVSADSPDGEKVAKSSVCTLTMNSTSFSA